MIASSSPALPLSAPGRADRSTDGPSGAAARFSGVVSGSSALVRQVVFDLVALSRQTPALSISFVPLDGAEADAWCADAPGRGIPVAFRVDVGGPAALVAPVRAFLVSLDDD